MISEQDHRQLIHRWLDWWDNGADEAKRPGVPYNLNVRDTLFEESDNLLLIPGEDDPLLLLKTEDFPETTQLTDEDYHRAQTFWELMQKILPKYQIDAFDDAVRIERVSPGSNITNATVTMRLIENDVMFEFQVDLLHVVSGGLVDKYHLADRRQDYFWYHDDNALRTPIFRDASSETRRELLGPDYPLWKKSDIYYNLFRNIDINRRPLEHRLAMQALSKRFGKLHPENFTVNTDDRGTYWVDQDDGYSHEHVIDYGFSTIMGPREKSVYNAAVRANWKMGPSFGSTIPADLPDDVVNQIFVMANVHGVNGRNKEERRAAEALLAGGWMIETDKHGKKIMVLKPEVLAKANRPLEKALLPPPPPKRPGKRRHDASTALVLVPPPAARPRTRRAATKQSQIAEDVL